jgi:hypothetical protein
MTDTRALVVAIENYADARNNLPGVANDAAAFVKVLAAHGVHNVEVLRDASATSDNIRNGLNALVDDAGADSVRIFYFSGHGALLPHGFLDSDDADGRDEAIVPYEGTTKSLILDNWMSAFLKQRLDAKTFFYGIYDCCHSGELYKAGPVLFHTKSTGRVKTIDFSLLRFDGKPQRFAGVRTSGFKPKVLVLDQGLGNSVHFGAAEPDNTALVLSIDGVNRSVFTWALEQVATPGSRIGDLEKRLAIKQAEKTSHHKPFVACSEETKARVFLR